MAVLYVSISVLNLMRATTKSQLQGDKERCNMGPLCSLKTSRAAAF